MKNENTLNNGSISIELPNKDDVKVPDKGDVNGVVNPNYQQAEGDRSLSSASTSDKDSIDKEKKSKKTQNVVSVRELFRYASSLDWFLMFIGTISAAINGSLQPVSFIVFGELIDKFIKKDKGEELDINEEMAKFAVFYVYVAVGSIIFGYLQNALWLMASINQSFRIRTSTFNSILRQDIGWFDTTDSGELSTRLADDITKIQNGIGDKVGAIQHAVFMLGAGVIIGFAYGWKLTLVIIALSPLLFIGAFAAGKVIGIITSQEQTSYAKAGAVAEEILSAIRTVVAFGGEGKEIARYRENLIEAEKAGIMKGISTGFAFALFNSILFGSMALGFWYGGTLIVEGELSGGTLLIVFLSVMMGANQFGQVGPNLETFSSARGSAYYIYSLIERKPVIDSMSEEGTKPVINGDISFVNCKFNYPSRPEVTVLKGLSLNIQKGVTCALVGESGCGKSTTVKLVQRFYDVLDGQVYIDNNDIKEINVKHLRKHIGVVSQEPVLFDTTIKENIRMGHPDATDEMIENAAKNANAHEFVSTLPQGYDTNVGEGGAQLSGGQKQRIAIARALVRDPKILLLDEATSALDTESEAIVQAALEKASEGRTTIIIAHRLSTVKNADMIAVVSNGQIIETGNHKSLMENRSDYFKLVMLQNFQQQAEEEEINSEIGSIISDTEREDIIARKMMKQISQLSVSSTEDEEKLKHMLQSQLSRTRSIKREKSQYKKEGQKSIKRQVSKPQNTEEEISEEELKRVPSFTRIMKLNAKEWPYIVVGAFFSACAGAMPVAFAIILAEILQSFATTDLVKLEKDMEFWSLMFLVLGFGIAISYFIAQYLFAIAGEALTTRLREMAFKSLLRQEIAYFDRPENSTGALAARLASDASAVQGATSTRLNTLTQVVVTGSSSLIVAFIYSWQLSLLIIAFIPFIVMFGGAQTKLNTSFAADSQKHSMEAGAVATEAIMQIRTVASLGKEDFFKKKYVELLEGPTKRSVKSAHIYGLLFGFSMGVLFFSNAACFRLGGYLASKENGLKLADIMKVIVAIQFGGMTAGQIASFAPDYIKAKVSAGRILDLFDRVPEIDSYNPDGRKDEIKGDIQFSGVGFSYPTRPNLPILQGLSIDILHGQTVAFVGASGCGKSTSVSLLERFYTFAAGTLKIDGIPIEEYNVKYLRSQIGIVQQEPTLFDRSIRDNILYGLDNPESVSQQDIENACLSSNIHHVIMNLPEGYDTKVGDKGTLISGGQKQRIAIARALIRDPKILLLDEATSALDSESEKVVQDALDHAMEGRTSIVIAHRLSTIQNADVIAVLQGGKIVEIGNHFELLALKGAYRMLTEAQL